MGGHAPHWLFVSLTHSDDLDTLSSRVFHIVSVHLPAFFAIFPIRYGTSRRFDEANFVRLRVIDPFPRQLSQYHASTV
jgi:hypothetical protein